VFGDAAIENEFHITGALELLEDGFICLGVGLDEGGGDDGEGASFAGVSRSGEETARHLECAGDDTTRLVSTAPAFIAAAHVIVIGAGEAGDGIHEDEDVLSGFDEALGTLDRVFLVRLVPYEEGEWFFRSEEGKQ